MLNTKDDSIDVFIPPQERLQFYLAMLEAWNHFNKHLGSVRYAQVWMAGAACWLSGFSPSINKLSEMTGIDRRSVKREIDRMERMGLLERNGALMPTQKGIAVSHDVVSHVLKAMRTLGPVCDRVAEATKGD